MGGPVFWVIRPHDLHVWIHKSISYPRQKWQVCILGQCDSKPGGTPGLSDYSHFKLPTHNFFVDAPDLHKHVKTMPRNSLVHHSFSKTACSLRFGTGDLGRRWILWKFYRWILWKVWMLSFECSISASKTCFTQQYWLVVSNIWIIFHFIYGMPSFPLTFIFFQRGGSTTNQNRPTIWGWFTSSNLGLIGCGSWLGSPHEMVRFHARNIEFPLGSYWSHFMQALE